MLKEINIFRQYGDLSSLYRYQIKIENVSFGMENKRRKNEENIQKKAAKTNTFRQKLASSSKYTHFLVPTALLFRARFRDVLSDTRTVINFSVDVLQFKVLCAAFRPAICFAHHISFEAERL